METVKIINITSIRSTVGVCGMLGKIMLPVIFAMAAFTAPADDADHNRNAVKAAGQLPGPLSWELLNTARCARGKIKNKQDCNREIKTLITIRKEVETVRLKMAADFAGQKAALIRRKDDSAASTALELQRRKVNGRFNELVRLIAQIDRNQKSALLAEKLNDLIVFLESTADPADLSESTVRNPEKLSRGTAPASHKNNELMKKRRKQ